MASSISVWVRPASSILRERRREQGVQLRAREEGEELVGHVGLGFRGGEVGRQVHAAGHGVRDGLVCSTRV